jgi:WD40 repeat protein
VAFSPDGRTVAAAFHVGAKISLYDVASGLEQGSLPVSGTWDVPLTLAFSPDRRHLAANTDKSVTLWNVPQVVGGAKRATPEELPALWTSLGSRDVKEAFQARCRLVLAEGAAVNFLNGRLRPVGKPPDHLAKLIHDLGSDNYSVRTRASLEIERFGQSATPSLRKALAGCTSPEMRRRIEAILAIPGELAVEWAIDVLESIGNKAAQRLLKDLADGLPEAPLTVLSRTALNRLESRAPTE